MEPHARTRVAIVEDHALTRAGLRTALEGSFDVVAEAADGLMGWEAILRERPDVAVIDIGIPAIDGMTLTKRVRTELARDARRDRYDARSRGRSVGRTGRGRRRLLPEELRAGAHRRGGANRQ